MSAVLLALLLLDDGPILSHLSVYPWQMHATTACGLALLLFGPRLVTLLATSAAWIALVVLVNGGADTYMSFIADEYLLFAALPVAGALMGLAARRSDRDELDAGQIAVFRGGLLFALFFAAFHKLNADFIDPASSCSVHLAQRLGAWWSLPFKTGSPLTVLALELLTPILLLRRPRLGIACALVLTTGLGHIGPVAFNTLVATGSLAFLPREALAAVVARGRRLATLAALLMAAAAPLSLYLYRGPYEWAPFYVLECALIVVAVAAFSAPRSAPARLPLNPRQRDLCWLLGAFLALNGISPYLGWKYRYSFAMLSNLRADDARWNHLIVPKSVRLRDDGYVHVLEVRSDTEWIAEPANPARSPTLVPGVFAPHEFRRRTAAHERRKLRVAVALRYRGQMRLFEDLLYDGAAQQFVAALPVERMLQPVLRLSGPQTCVH